MADAKVEFNPGRYLKYDEMTAFLQACAAAYPELCRLAEIGRSAEGRSIWAVTLTNTATGPDTEKPGYLIDANTHAGEVTGGTTVLYAIHKLLTGYGECLTGKLFFSDMKDNFFRSFTEERREDSQVCGERSEAGEPAIRDSGRVEQWQ